MKKIYYVRYTEDNPAEDGIWLETAGRPQFFLREEAAKAEEERRNDEYWLEWQKSTIRTREKWEKTEAAYKALEEVGHDAKTVFPYHKREFTVVPPKPRYVVDWLEVVE